MKEFHGETTISQTDTTITLRLADGIYRIRSAGIRTDSTLPNAFYISQDWIDSSGTAHSDYLLAGWIQHRTSGVLRDFWVRGPADLVFGIIKLDGTQSFAFVYYDHFTDVNYNAKGGGLRV